MGTLSRMSRRLLLVAALLAAALALPATASAAPTPDARAQVVDAVVRAVPGARVNPLAGEPLLGVPAVDALAAGRAEVMMDPAFWTQVVGNLLVSRTVVLPTPVDLVKPEMYLPTAPVAPGSYVWPLARRPVDLSGVRYDWQGRQKSLQDFVPLHRDRRRRVPAGRADRH